MLQFDRELPSRPRKMQVLTYLLIKCGKLVAKNSIIKDILLNFMNLSTILCPRLSVGSHFSFIAWFKIFLIFLFHISWLEIFIDFSFWKGPSVLRIEIYGNWNSKPWYIPKGTVSPFSIVYKFGTRPCSKWSRAVFMKIANIFLLKIGLCGSFQVFSKKQKLKEKVFRQSRTKHLWTFSRFTRVCFHRKWNRSTLSSLES